MDNELKTIEENETWELVDLPKGHKAIDSKWVYNVKFRPDGNVERLKVESKISGSRRHNGKGYKHTFSPVAKFTTVRSLIALATIKGWPLHDVDINNAFLHGFLEEEEVYMKVPLGYTVSDGKVFKLKKSLYNLKQASRQ